MATLGDRVVLFGGWTANDTCLNDTWTWDGSQWHLETPAHQPPARGRHMMATLGNRVVLFAGNNETAVLGDTWVWDGDDWQDVSAGAIGVRNVAVMAAVDDRVILFGSYGAGAFAELDDTWAWDGSSWSPLSVSGPTARSFAAMATLFGAN